MSGGAQGRTGTVKQILYEGRPWYAKTNPAPELTAIESRIYDALRTDSELLALGVKVPETRTANDILLVEDCGQTLADLIHIPDESRLRSVEFLDHLLRTRSRVNAIVNFTLTVADQQFLTARQQQKLYERMRELAPQEPSITPVDIAIHYWAYQVLAAIGTFDPEFKEAYTRLVGKKIDAALPQFGTWMTDNCLRNNAYQENGTAAPFDFNSIRFGLRQMDEAAIAGHYVFIGPLGILKTPEEREEYIRQLSRRFSPEIDPQAYFSAFALSAAHKHALLSGYRTEEAKALFAEVKKTFETSSKFDGQKFYQARAAFDEIDYHNAPFTSAIDLYATLLDDPECYSDLAIIRRTVTHQTFGQRVLLFSDPIWRAGVELYERYGPKTLQLVPNRERRTEMD